MASISGIGSSNYAYGQYASGKKINTSADGAAESAIIEKQKANTGALKQKSNNALSQRDANNIADGAIAGITDNLQRINELNVQKSNGLYSDDDKRIIQNEIDQLTAGINDVAGQAKYNETNLLGDVSGMSIEDISAMRSKFGASTNGLESQYAGNQNTIENLTSSVSRLEDLDVAEAISETKKKETLQQYQMAMQKKQMQDQQNLHNNLFA